MIKIKSLSKKAIFIISTLFLGLLLMILFWFLGKNENLKSADDAISEEQELAFASDTRTLDSLYNQLQTEVYSKNVSAIAQVNVQWDKHRTAFISQYAASPVLSQHVAQVLSNFRERVKIVKQTYRVKSISRSQADKLKILIKEEEIKKEELKMDQQMIKQALLSI